MYTENKIRDCQGKSSFQQEEDTFHQQTGLKFEEETGKELNLEHSFVWCGNLDTSENQVP